VYLLDRTRDEAVRINPGHGPSVMDEAVTRLARVDPRNAIARVTGENALPDPRCVDAGL
jgi:hypothetical protein